MALEEQTKKIEEKRKDVMADLAQVEPAVIEAQNGLTQNYSYFYFKIVIDCLLSRIWSYKLTQNSSSIY